MKPLKQLEGLPELRERPPLCFNTSGMTDA